MSRNDEIMACVKHFALYGASEAGRDYNTVDMSRQRMFNEYMLPYQAAVEAGARQRNGFVQRSGRCACHRKQVADDRCAAQAVGFDGFVVTDYTGINEMIDHAWVTSRLLPPSP